MSEDKTVQETNQSPIPGAKVLLVGDAGDGKTHSIRTLVDAGITPFVIFTEQSQTILGDIPEDKCHWKYIAPADVGWAAMMKNVQQINSLSFEALTKVQDPNKKKFTQFYDFISACNEFTCDRTGENFGDVADWGTDRCLVLDSLTGLNDMAMGTVVGNKPVKAPGEWQIAMDLVNKMLNAFVANLHCHFVCISHLERQKDEISGAIKLMPATLGTKLAPKIPMKFDDVIRAVHKEKEFIWSTVDAKASLKTRHLKYLDRQKPSFIPLIESWKKQGGIIEQ